MSDESQRDQQPGFHSGEQTLAKVPSIPDSPGTAGCPDDLTLRIAQRMEELPDGQRRALRWRHFENWSLQQIADELGKTPRQVARMLITGARALDNVADSDTHQTSATLNSPEETVDDLRADDTLAQYLQEIDGGSVAAPEQMLAENPQSACALQAYFQVAKQLDRAAYMLLETLAPTPDNLRDETHVAGDTVSTTSGTTLATRAFGDYQLLGSIGVGGMGVVYKARQRKLNRLVALKMIRAGQFADEHDVERFHLEAEAAASLRHPHIVAVHEVGQYDGQHFFTMDFIEGRGLDELVRENTFPPPQAARLVKIIAEAIHFAHEKGILHRDIKPSNILLDDAHDQRPLLTDFGLAKRISDESGMTMSGAIVGTPSYSAPEQLKGNGKQVGPASDVYGLGALLYELLASRPPFRAATPLETVRQVLDSEPASPRLLNPDVPRDLETICLKCLEKEPASRYASAEELAAELDRYLEDKPILARPVSRMVRVWRWCRRNPKIAASLATAALGVMAAFLAIAIGYASTTTALEETEEARQSEMAAKEEAESAQKRDEASFRLARQAVNELFTEVSENTLLNQPGMQPLRQDLLRRSLKYYEKFLAERSNDKTLRDELALAQFRVGLITEAIGSADKALAALENARTAQTQLVRETPNSADRRYALSNTLNMIGVVHHKMQDPEAAAKAHREALALRQRLADESPENAEYQRKLANSQMNIAILEKAQGRLDDALHGMEQAQAIRHTTLDKNRGNVKLQRDLGKGYYNLANLALALQSQALANQNTALADDRLKQAVENLRKAIEVFQKQVERQPNDFTSQIQLATCYGLLADLRSYQGQHDEAARAEAIQLYDDAQPILESLVRLNPDVARYQVTLAGLYLNQGMLHSIQRQADTALAAYERARQILNMLVDRYPEVPVYQRDLANAFRAIATVQTQLKQWQQARASLDDSLKLLEALVAAHPRQGEFTQLRDQATADIRRLRAIQAVENP